MPNIKKYLCTYCNTKDPNKFDNGRKTVCYLCIPMHNSLLLEQRKQNTNKKYKCIFCDEIDKKKFHEYCKNKCMKHYNCKGGDVEEKEKICCKVKIVIKKNIKNNPINGEETNTLQV